MSFLKAPLQGIVDLIFTIKDKRLAWKSANQVQQIQLSHRRTLADQQLAAALAKKSVQLSHEISLLKVNQAAELSMLKTRCQEEIKDYQQYLESLNQLKQLMKASYAELPDAFILSIHHHAKALLNAMWEANSLEEKIAHEAQLVKFMATLHDEVWLFRSGATTDRLPENTLRLMRQDSGASSLH